MQIRTAVIYVFSGTGNTLTAANMIRHESESLGVRADIYKVYTGAGTPPDPNNYDAVLLGYPIHAFNTPKYFISFIKTLPEAAMSQPLYVFKTSGEPFAPNNASSAQLISIMRRKGYLPACDMHMLMPYNIMFRYPDAIAGQMYRHTGAMSQMLAKWVAAGRCEHPRYGFFAVLCSYALRVQRLGAYINGPLTYAKKSICTGCGICAAHCPAKNITIKDSRAHFGAKCTMCMSCSSRCPRDAVRCGILNLWRVNGGYDYGRIIADASLERTPINRDARGYFSLFNKYFERTQRQMERFGVEKPPSK